LKLYLIQVKYNKQKTKSIRKKEEKIITRRQKRVEHLLRKEVEDIIRREVSNPNVGFFTITSVNITPDFKFVKIGISFLGSAEEKQKSFKAIENATGYIQFKLGKRISLRDTPKIQFELDERKEFRIEKLLSEIKKEENEENKEKN